MLKQPVEGRELLVVADGGLEKVDNILVLDILGAVAGQIERAEASGVR